LQIVPSDTTNSPRSHGEQTKRSAKLIERGVVETSDVGSAAQPLLPKTGQQTTIVDLRRNIFFIMGQSEVNIPLNS
jgi:hypothetical protein